MGAVADFVQMFDVACANDCQLPPLSFPIAHKVRWAVRESVKEKELVNVQYNLMVV